MVVWREVVVVWRDVRSDGGGVERCEKWWWVWRDVRRGGGCGEM